jgi:sulfite exporter TauE/SafE
MHCLGMCGPLVLVLPGRQEGPLQVLASGLEYNLGRITTYMLMGLVFGLLGQGLLMGHTQQYVAIGLGVIMLLACLSGFNIDAWAGRWPLFIEVNNWIKKRFQQLLSRQSRLYFFGLLNGILPCGMVYLALAGAVTMEHTSAAVAFMFSFGLGTLPAMLTPFFFGQGIRKYLRPYLPYIQTAALAAMGLLLIFRGLQIEFPAELSFWEMLKNPVMCH